MGLMSTHNVYAAEFTVQVLTFPDADFTDLSDINDLGVIAGHFGFEDPDEETWTAFTYDGTAYSTFSVPGAWGTFARGINSQGIVVGEFGSASGSGGFIAAPVPEPSSALLLLMGLFVLKRWRRPTRACS